MDSDELRAQLEAHHEACLGWALHCCSRDIHAAEETLQSVYLKVIEGRVGFRGEAAFRTWIFGVIRNAARDHFRRRKLWSRIVQKIRGAGTESEARVHPNEEPDARLARSEESARFLKLLDGLSPRQREVLHLVFYQDLTIEEAAGLMEISLGSARTHYERGKARLRTLLSKTGRKNRNEEGNDESRSRRRQGA